MSGGEATNTLQHQTVSTRIGVLIRPGQDDLGVFEENPICSVLSACSNAAFVTGQMSDTEGPGFFEGQDPTSVGTLQGVALGELLQDLGCLQGNLRSKKQPPYESQMI